MMGNVKRLINSVVRVTGFEFIATERLADLVRENAKLRESHEEAGALTGLVRIPHHVHDIGRTADATRVGLDYLRWFQELGGLRSDHRVLDVGCGLGRMAIPLLFYLNEQGSYEGFDIGPEAIEWCKEHITTYNPRFHFERANVHNQFYNPTGAMLASEYNFPYESESFDFAFLTSVFTHMIKSDVENYLSEIARTLKSGKNCFITFFLINDESRRLIKAGKAYCDFNYNYEDYSINDIDVPDATVAFEETYMRKLYGKCGLEIIEPVRYGSWCGRANFLSFQDIVIAVKK